MIDAGSIMSAIGALKTAGDIAKATLDLRETEAIKAKVSELMGVILSAQRDALAAQMAQSTLLDRIRELESRVVEAEDLARQKKRYQRTDFGCGTFAHVLKPDMAEGEPSHRICTHCYDEGRISSLQHRHHSRNQETVWCATHGVIRLGCPGELPTHSVNPNRPRRRTIY